MSTKYENFKLEDLPKSAVVNSSMYTRDQEVDELINEAVSDHISKIVENTIDEENSVEDASEALESLQKNTNDSLGAHNVLHEEDLAEVNIDIEAIKEEFYQKGIEESKIKYEAIISQHESNKSLFEKLVQKLDLISLCGNFDAQIAKVSAEAIAGIARKLYLVLPVNFEEIIRNGLIEKLKSFYKEGQIMLIIHPDRYDFCAEVFQSNLIPSKFKGNFQIIPDDKVGMDDCILDYNETRLEYNQEQLNAEIDKIIEQLKSTR